MTNTSSAVRARREREIIGFETSGEPALAARLQKLVSAGACAATIVSAVACATTDPVPASTTAPRDANAQSAPVAKRSGAPLDGASARTIDPALQGIVEEEIDRLASEWSPRAAAVVVLDPSSGAILAIANRAAEAPTEVATERTYLTGSTMKSFVVAAALDDGVVTPTQQFDCATRAFGARRYHDHAPHGTLAVREILEVSSNVGVSRIFDELGGARFLGWAHRFHFGEAPPLGLPGVAAGTVPASLVEKTYEGAEAANGELITASPLQVAAAFVAIANGGVYHRPTLTSRADVGERVLREETAHTVLAMLEAAVASEKGTGTAARVDGVRVAGKTGTADLASGREDATEFYSSFVGTAPIESPRYVVLVGAERPKNGGTGGQVAAPTFARVMKRALAR